MVSAQQRQASSLESSLSSMAACTIDAPSAWRAASAATSAANSKWGSLPTFSRKSLFRGSDTVGGFCLEEFSDFALVEPCHDGSAGGAFAIQLHEQVGQKESHSGD